MKKIMFNDRYGLTEAVLEKRKTVTRCIIPPIKIEWNRRGRVTLPVSVYKHGVLWMDCRQILPDSGLMDYVAPQKYQPKYSIGEEVAVAQNYRSVVRIANKVESVWNFLVEKNFMQKGGAINTEFCTQAWTNKMFVRADLMPHRIRITNIKLERLQDISDKNCLKEGIVEENTPTDTGYSFYGTQGNWQTPREAFAALIDKVSGNGTWERNPWVFVYEFELIK